MNRFQRFREEWLRPFLFYGNNLLSLIGVALTTASALVLVGYWIVTLIGHGGSLNPYIGIIFDFLLPGLFVLGLLIIPVGIWLRYRRLRKAGQVPMAYPEFNLNNPALRRGIMFVFFATFINFIIVGTASYRGVAYMDQASFCGTTCHVMKPEWVAYHHSQFHTNVACTECHIAPGISGFIHAKANGTKQMFMVLFDRYPRPIMPENKLPAASETCERCHSPDHYYGDDLVIQNNFGDDKGNSLTHTVLVMHVGGRTSAGVYKGIHGAHNGLKIEYRATDNTNKVIPWVEVIHPDGTRTVYEESGFKGKLSGKPRVMGCYDCHNRPAHSFKSPSQAVNGAMSAGLLDTSLPYLHKEGMALIQRKYSSQVEAGNKIPAALEAYYQKNDPTVWSKQRSQIESAGKELVALYDQNVFPSMNVTWGSHPSNIGHMDYPGCFRCHDGSHVTKSGKNLTNDCTVCHSIVAMDDPNPKPLQELQMLSALPAIPQPSSK